MRRLTKLQTDEVSLVPEGANRKRWLITKENEIDNNKILDKVRGSSPSVLNKIFEVVVKSFGKKENDEDGINDKLEGLSPAAQTAARAIGRIAAPHADELKANHVNAVLNEVGIDGAEETESEGGSKVKPEHMEAAKSAGVKAYKAQMEKLGYEKYPEAELSMKAEKTKKEDDDEKEEAEKAKAMKAKKEKEEKESKVGKENILKEDGTLNLDAVPAEMRATMEVVQKSMFAAASRAQAAEAKATQTEQVLKEHRESTRKAEIVRKSFEFKSLRQEDVQKTLELADRAGAEEFERVIKMFEAQDSQISAGNLFSEKGNAGMSDGSMSAWAKIEKAADGIVQKSAEKITKEQAITDFLDTAEGQNLYAQHQAARPNRI